MCVSLHLVPSSLIFLGCSFAQSPVVPYMYVLTSVLLNVGHLRSSRVSLRGSLSDAVPRELYSPWSPWTLSSSSTQRLFRTHPPCAPPLPPGALRQLVGRSFPASHWLCPFIAWCAVS